MLSELKKGDDVVTQGGIIGKITGMKDTELTLQLQEGVRVRVLRSAVTGLYTGRRVGGEARDEVRSQSLLIGLGRTDSARMERAWWWKAALYGFVTVVAVLYLIPTLVPEEKQPAFIKSHFQKRIQLGLDLQGGLHLVYEVNVDKAVSDKVDRLSSDIEDRLRRDKGVTELNVDPRGPRRHHPHLQEPGRPGQGRRGAAARSTASRSTSSTATRPPAWCGCASIPIRSRRCATTRSARASRRSAAASTSWASPSRPSSRRGPTSSSSSPASSPPTSSASSRSSAAPRSSSSRSSTTARST